MGEGVGLERFAGADDDSAAIAIVGFDGGESDHEVGLIVAEAPAFFEAAIVFERADQATVAGTFVNAAPGGDGEGIGGECVNCDSGSGAGAIEGEAGFGGEKLGGRKGEVGSFLGGQGASFEKLFLKAVVDQRVGAGVGQGREGQGKNHDEGFHSGDHGDSRKCGKKEDLIICDFYWRQQRRPS